MRIPVDVYRALPDAQPTLAADRAAVVALQALPGGIECAFKADGPLTRDSPESERG